MFNIFKKYILWKPKLNDEVVDVVIVGSGLAGLSVALTIADAGLSAIVLEKDSQLGGNSWISGGAISCPCTPEQKRHLGESCDSSKDFYEDILKNGGYKNDDTLVRVLTGEILSAIEWTKKVNLLQYL